MKVGELVRPYPIARRLPVAFDPAELVADLDQISEEWWRRHAGPYHDGGWKGVSLWAPRGDAFEQRSFGGEFAATPALLKTRYLKTVLDSFPAERNRVRLMKLEPGSHILPHSDPLHSIDPRLVRLHVPVVTNPEVEFRVAGRSVPMRPAETWHVDVRFRHSVHNRGRTDRVHLVMDLVRNDQIDAILAAGEVLEERRLVGYFAKHALPGRLLRALGADN